MSTTLIISGRVSCRGITSTIVTSFEQL